MNRQGTHTRQTEIIQKRENSGKGRELNPPTYGLPFIDKSVMQRKENKTGMSDSLKSGIESLSGMDMSDVKVHYNSSQPAQLNAHAYAQGTDIHVAPGQEKHVPHEAWHVVQQKQGRVKPTMQMKGKVPVNDNATLEHEADVMGTQALQMKTSAVISPTKTSVTPILSNEAPVQRVRVSNSKNTMVLESEADSERLSVSIDGSEVGYVTFSNEGRGVMSQGYIKVESAYNKNGISYVLSYLSAQMGVEGGVSIIYLGGGSLSPSGALLASKLGFKSYEPQAQEATGGGGWCSWLTSCFGGGSGAEEEPLISRTNTSLLDYAYQRQAEQAGGSIAAIRWLTASEVRDKSLQKMQEYGWQVSG